MRHSPYALLPNFATLKCRIDKIEAPQESKNGNMYLVVWLSQNKFFKDEKTTHYFKIILFNDDALQGATKLEEGMYVRVSGELKGSNVTNNDTVFNKIEFKVNDIEPLSPKKDDANE